ncbi:Modification methylase DpnIIA [termite gut metagenome]|uniref:Modification methylase DpnIIA n=1 Tax=termite gut metagenome TaxID=433724 RepID=A0A5J4QWP3_9ZZZZ
MITSSYQIHEFKKSHDYAKSPFRYAGGKFYALKHILPFIDCVPHDEYREPFIGGGSIFFAKKKAKINFINDLDTDIIDVYTAFANKNYTDIIISMLKNEVATKERHEQIKKMIPTNFIEKVYRTYYLNRTSYCGIINTPAWGYKTGKSSPPQNWDAFISAIENKLKSVHILNLDFEKIIQMPAEGKSVLLYLDPPYFLADQKRAYTKSFILDDHIRLAKLLKLTPFHFCLSYDNVPKVKELYSWANIYEKRWLYNTANKKGEQREKGNELIITNYTIKPMTTFPLDF